MRIVLCEDDGTYLYHMEKLITELNAKAEIYKYSSANELIASSKFFDLAFLDIEMKNGDGFEAAKYLKQKNPDCVIAFFTNYDSYARKGYEYRAYRYILKDEGDKLIKHHFAETIKEYYRLNGQVSLIYGNGKRIEFIRDILYIEMNDHYGCVHLKNGMQCLWRKTLSNIELYLSDFNFLRCHNSYIVNLEYVKLKKKNQLILCDGVSIPIGKAYSKAVSSKYKL